MYIYVLAPPQDPHFDALASPQTNIFHPVHLVLFWSEVPFFRKGLIVLRNSFFDKVFLFKLHYSDISLEPKQIHPFWTSFCTKTRPWKLWILRFSSNPALYDSLVLIFLNNILSLMNKHHLLGNNPSFSICPSFSTLSFQCSFFPSRKPCFK